MVILGVLTVVSINRTPELDAGRSMSLEDRTMSLDVSSEAVALCRPDELRLRRDVMAVA